MEKETGGACNMHREEGNANRVLVGKSEKRPHVRPSVYGRSCQRNRISSSTLG
jgi:hypothetical protein